MDTLIVPCDQGPLMLSDGNAVFRVSMDEVIERPAESVVFERPAEATVLERV